MIKWLSIFLFVFVFSNISFAQKNTLIIQGTSPNLYLVHKVTPKENFYSIGRMYNVAPKDIASYNNLQFQNGLSIGQSLKIPLNENNFSQSGSADAGEVLVPVYHHLQSKEGLYRVSINYNKVPMSSIKHWNHLKTDDVSVGTPLIVGYLKVNKNESALANKAIKNNDVAATDTETKQEPIPPVVNPERLPPVKKPDEEKTEKKDETKVDNDNTSSVKNISTKSTINFSGGYFKNLYNQQIENKSAVNSSGNAGVFKSTSGWQDGKYYCFNNDAPPGSVIRITDNATNKSVYAKVLDAIPDIKQNSGLSIILSNSAAEELGEADKFNCELSYAK